MIDLNKVAEICDWTFIQPYGTADTYLMCALMEAFTKKNPGTVMVVVKQSHKPIAEMFDRWIARIVTVPDSELLEMARRCYHCRFVAPKTPVVLHPHFLGDGRIDALTTLEGFADKDMYAHLLALPRGISLPAPEIKEEWVQEAVSLAQKIGLVRDRTVILVPDANSYPSPSTTFWTELSQKLSNVGWTVVTNLWGNNRQKRLVPFAGSTGISPPLELLLPLAEYCGWVVSTLTGSLALLYMAQVPCKKTVIGIGPEPGQEQRYNDNFSLRHAFPYASQRKCDGFDHEAQEVMLYSSENNRAEVINDIVYGHYADHGSECPSTLPMVPLFIPTSPGDLFDRISVLQIKRERITSREALHYVKRELLHLESVVARTWPLPSQQEMANQFIKTLKAENIIGWEGIDYVYDRLEHDNWLWGDARMALEMINKYRELRDSNKRRAVAKRAANVAFGSSIMEMKTY